MNLTRLFDLLKLARPYGSQGEDEVAEMLAPHSPSTYCDGVGFPLAYVILVGESDTLFSAHLDTAESATSSHNLLLEGGTVRTDGASILGADDGAGVWLLLEMIDAGVPGAYIFTRGEERGGVGAKFMAEKHPGFLGSFKRAVAFDRRGTDSVITRQGWGRCCSDAFANAVADGLNSRMLEHGFFMPDESGIYTDNAEWTDLIPEVTNISCGYQFEHTYAETLDLEFLIRLRDAVIAFDWESLPTVRDPAMQETRAFGFEPEFDGDPLDEGDLLEMDYRDVVKWVRESDPEAVAALLLQLAEDLAYGKSCPVSTRIEEDETFPYGNDDRLNVGMY